VGPRNECFSKSITDARARPEWIIAFLGQFREKYGTVEDYVKNQVGLSDGDIDKIRANLLIPKPVPN
jgi:hypothetical protein